MPGPLDVRRAGVLLHVTSLPEPGGLGRSAYDFVDFLHAAGCTVWQVLPVGPTHAEDRSPYNAVSAMAGDPELVDQRLLVADGLLDRGAGADADPAEARAAAARRVLADPARTGFADWRRRNASWLEDYVRFVALRDELGGRPWLTWPAGLRDREPRVLDAALQPLADRVDVLAAEQWLFADQWSRLKAYAASRGVLLFGDLPIFVSHDSADVWAHRDLFLLDEEGQPTEVSGVPPDYFAAAGQRWNNPHYDWRAMARDAFAWWRRRVAVQRERFDLVRIDHFRGFEAAWHVPVAAPTAKDGRWVRSPGRDILAALVETAGPGTLVAEDLGTITPAVERLRREFALPGMKVLQFAFDGDPDNAYLPEHHRVDDVVYTGTHDNDTTMGWWAGLDAETRDRVVEQTGGDLPWGLVALAMASPGRLAVVPAQDLLELGSQARMNTPGTDSGNWRWRASPEAFGPALTDRLRGLVQRTGRLPDEAWTFS